MPVSRFSGLMRLALAFDNNNGHRQHRGSAERLPAQKLPFLRLKLLRCKNTIISELGELH